MQFLLGLFVAQAVAELFEHDHLVRELHTPIELRQVIDTLHGTRLILMYSGWCPHCLSFAPVWSDTATRLYCDANKDVKMNAFECTGTAEERHSPITEWDQLFDTHWGEGDFITPIDLCKSLVPQGYPTILLSVPDGFNTSSLTDFEPLPMKLKSTLPQAVTHPDHLFILSSRLSPDSSAMSQILIDNHIAGVCQKTVPHTDVSQLRLQASVDTPRWSQTARRVDPDGRLHDAMLGLHHILGSWLFSDRDELDSQARRALMNFLLAVTSTMPDQMTQKSLRDLMTLVAKGDPVSDYIKRDLDLMGVDTPHTPEDVRTELLMCKTNSGAVWTLLHTMAAINYQASLHTPNRHCVTLAEDGDDLEKKLDEIVDDFCVRGRDIAEAIHQLIYTFFNCTTCRGHFHDAYDSCVADRCTWVSDNSPVLQSLLKTEDLKASEDLGLMLWLWRFHNVVSFRTATEKSLREIRSLMDAGQKDNFVVTYLNQDVRIPLKADCDTCHTPHTPAVSVSQDKIVEYVTNGEDKGSTSFDFWESFNLSEVTNYLNRFYYNDKWSEFASVRYNKESRSFIEETVWNDI
eukprot:Blabericola_migrator_1__3446@NODE_2016_length_3415_cov_116_252389_g1231_i1_p1_GENE_NODE_2016_length_3415_cov_116_252389_g1231_i1NODE_2016_length_3415_cov_116_252389_g1231_i1_p1_ORF_typecomplete_len574_score145_74Evr1_Alr/PF04777_13/1_7e04Evr1_Alr/PF04777_13/6_1e12Evr1_Alr/PF04777_13/1_8e04Thioredoxin/PF00085_20/7_1e06CxC5/PF18718_1/6_5e02CxC5/PF18718_1/1_3CxC5/PF18718_1/2_4e02_NODE_2016_length_3415_cov_116_252389_g1231_i15012222